LTYYEVLGVPQNASIDQIERAYRTLARKVHPDLHGAEGVRADERMKQLNLIRETLSDPLLRAAYDDRLRRERPAPRPSAPPPTPPAPAPAAAAPTRSGYRPHPHVVAFLRTEAERQQMQPPGRQRRSPVLAFLAVGGIGAAVVLLWPEPVRPPPPPPTTVVMPAAPAHDGVVVVRGDQTATRKAVRKSGKVVPVGFTFDEVVSKFGPPDRVETGSLPEDMVLIYGQSRVEMRDGKVVGGSP
jgi:hypothetical protein